MILAIKDVMKRKRDSCYISKFAGTTSFDSLHLAISEKNAKVFLTTDIKKSRC